MKNSKRVFLLLLVLLFFVVQPGICQRFQVSHPDELKKALSQISAGDQLELFPGVYGGISLKNLHGSRQAPIVIEGIDPNLPPVLKGRGEGLKLTSCSYIKISNVILRGFQTNGVNIDDGGKSQASHHIILENIHILETGGSGNQDAVKMAGVTNFIVRDSRIEGWGDRPLTWLVAVTGLLNTAK